MPTYQYSCTECGHFFEQVQSFSEDSLTSCPVCSGRLRKVFNAVGVVFKGSGFYRTDSRSEGRSETRGETGDGGTPKSGDGGGDGKGGGGGAGGTKAGSDGGGTSAPAASGTGAASASGPSSGSKGSSDAA